MADPRGDAGPRRGRWWVLAVLALGAAALFATIVELSTEEGGDPKVEVSGVNDAQRIFGGLRQEGDRLGEPDAPVAIQVFTDVQCGNCAGHFLETIPPLVEGPVRDGRVKMLYRHYGFGPRPVEQGFIAAEAAGEQGYQWPYVYLFFASLGETERLGSVSADFLGSLAASIGELDVPEWERDIAEKGGPDGAITRRLESQDEVARGLGLRARPSVIVTGPRGTVTLQDFPQLDQIEAAIDDVE
jgi:protein-disulfide isomerase